MVHVKLIFTWLTRQRKKPTHLVHLRVDSLHPSIVLHIPHELVIACKNYQIEPYLKQPLLVLLKEKKIEVAKTP